MSDDQKTLAISRMKRSRTLQVTSLMATASFSLAACGDAPSAPAQVEAPPQPTAAYTSLQECLDANNAPDSECRTAYAEAEKARQTEGPRYMSRAECEGTWGPSQCEPTNNGSGGSFFTPLLAGFIIGQALDGGRYRPMYRDQSGRYSNGFGGGYAYRDYRSGRLLTNGRDYDVARQAPARVQSRTAVVSRGGFGGGGRGYGG